ncbi:MAG: polymer-forming cytoskeletal protein [Trueperaceae bacterium]
MADRRPGKGPYSYVHADTSVEGSFHANGRARVDGLVRGPVRVRGLLQVGPGGRIEGGPVRAQELHVAGIVTAPVIVPGAVEVWRGGRLEGEVRAGSLAIEMGGTFVGRRVEPGEAAQADPASPGPAQEPMDVVNGVRNEEAP